MARRPKKEKKGAPEYMLTYGDMMTLLLCFFVLLFSFSSVDKKQFEKLVSAFKAALGVMPGAKIYSPDGAAGLKGKVIKKINQKKLSKQLVEIKKLSDKQLQSEKKKEKIQRQLQLISKFLAKEIKEKKVVVEYRDIGIVLRIPQVNFFELGSVKLSPESKFILKKIAYLLKLDLFKEYKIAVEGHSDATPVKSKKIPSNWELSALRAAAVARFFNQEEKIPGTRLKVEAFSYFKPFVKKKPIKGIGVPENRRVEIVLYTD
jgi:chemotaxis protein MotB